MQFYLEIKIKTLIEAIGLKTYFAFLHVNMVAYIQCEKNHPSVKSSTRRLQLVNDRYNNFVRNFCKHFFLIATPRFINRIQSIPPLVNLLQKNECIRAYFLITMIR